MNRLLHFLPWRWFGTLAIWLCLAGALLPQALHATPMDLSGTWFQANAGWQYSQQPDLSAAGLPRIARVAPTGGNYWHQADVVIASPGAYVIDFKNSSLIGHFRHWLFDADGKLVAMREGGIQSAETNPFFLRHGRDLMLTPGTYRLVSQLDSPMFLAPPEVYIDTLAHYRQAIKPGNALVLICLGIFVGLGFYYAALALVRRRMAERMYALFILGNLLWNGMCLLVLPDLFGVHWFYLGSFPILFSNCAYIGFVMALLEIERGRQPRLYFAGIALLGLFASFIVVALVRPNWSLELDRYGVGLFMAYGLAAALVCARRGNRSARYYLVAIAAFFVLGAAAISLGRLETHTLYIEHIGLLAVAVEVMLLALVLSYQFALLNHEKESALSNAEKSILMARTDSLTGLPNRFHLDHSLATLPDRGSLTIIDLDGLKHYNDNFGHARGDELLRSFSTQLQECLHQGALLHRVGGDEFAVTCAAGDVAQVEVALAHTLQRLREQAFGLIGASWGSALVQEAGREETLKHLADTRMYQKKQANRQRRSTDQVTPSLNATGAG